MLAAQLSPKTPGNTAHIPMMSFPVMSVVGPTLPGVDSLRAYGTSDKIKAKIFYFLRKAKKTEHLVRNENRAMITTTDRIAIHNKFSALEEEGVDLVELNQEEFKSTMNEASVDHADAVMMMRETRYQTLPKKRQVTFTDSVCQTGTEISIQAGNGDINSEEPDTHRWTAPKRRDVNKIVKNKKHFAVLTKLYYFLKTKYFMKVRDTQMLSSIVQDARIWMSTNKYTSEDSSNYDLFTLAVMSAYMPDENEMQFRAVLKRQDNLDNIYHLNKTIKGDLGKSLKKTLGIIREESRIPLDSLRLPTPGLQA